MLRRHQVWRDNHHPAATDNPHPDCRAPLIQIVAPQTLGALAYQGESFVSGALKPHSGYLRNTGLVEHNYRLRVAVG